MTTFATPWNQGRVFWKDQEKVGDIPWSPHAKFPGVALKHLVTAAETEGRMSCHLVRIDPGCAIGDHVHETQYELHEVIEGAGQAQVADKTIAYVPGVQVMVPEKVNHRIDAGEAPLYLLAKFVPALL